MSILSGQSLLVASGVAQVIGVQNINSPLLIKAHPDNTGNVVIGNDGEDDVDFSTGVVLEAGDVIVFNYVGDIEDIYLNGYVENEGICWITLE